ncbi:MAG TPA: hypothetical protein VFY71_12070, partial [Planctomycetota bacterium]|nr:hypothetical protein [Planctomycetota bacterium]
MALHSPDASPIPARRGLSRALPLLVLGVLGAARADVFVVAESAGDVVTRVNAFGVKTSLVASGLDDP